jgi:hypothetical protein
MFLQSQQQKKILRKGREQTDLPALQRTNESLSKTTVASLARRLTNRPCAKSIIYAG